MRFAVFAVISCIALAACQQTPSASNAPPKEYVLHGEVMKLDPSSQLATVNGAKIEGWMDAMTMDYPVRDKQAFGKLKVGEKIDAKVMVQGTDYWLADVSEAASAAAQPSAPPSK